MIVFIILSVSPPTDAEKVQWPCLAQYRQRATVQRLSVQSNQEMCMDRQPWLQTQKRHNALL